MNLVVKKYLSSIGRKGGKKSRRSLSAQTARDMVKIREARRAFHGFYSQCFWSYDENYIVTKKDIPWVVEQLRKHGNQTTWKIAEKLCR